MEPDDELIGQRRRYRTLRWPRLTTIRLDPVVYAGPERVLGNRQLVAEDMSPDGRAVRRAIGRMVHKDGEVTASTLAGITGAALFVDLDLIVVILAGNTTIRSRSTNRRTSAGAQRGKGDLHTVPACAGARGVGVGLSAFPLRRFSFAILDPSYLYSSILRLWSGY